MSKDNKPDQSFNSIANKFEKNIYGSSKGKLRHELLLKHLHKTIKLKDHSLKILDAGGGTGIMSTEMCNLGHQVVLNDVSCDVLRLAQDKFSTDSNITFVQQEIQSLPYEDEFDVVMCHAVLEWLNSPLDALEKLLSMTKASGFVSLSFFNRDAHVFGNLLYGNFDYVESGLHNKNTVRLNPNNALYPQDVISALNKLGCSIVHTAGIRCIHDYLKQPEMQTERYQELLEMELKYGVQNPYKWLGKYFHVIIQKDL